MLARLRTILRFSPPEIVEVIFGGLTLVRGLWLLLPFSTFEANPVYRVMALFPENGWGAIFVSLGAAQIIAVALPQCLITRRARLVIGAAQTFVWVLSTALWALANWQTLGPVTGLVCAAAQYWATTKALQPRHEFA